MFEYYGEIIKKNQENGIYAKAFENLKDLTIENLYDKAFEKSKEEKMKTWKDIEAGDSIYYYDHGKIHEQKVHSAEFIQQTHEYNFSSGVKSSWLEEYILIKAGRGSSIKIFKFEIDDLRYKDRYFNRFNTKEEEIRYIYERKNYLENKVKIYKKQYEKWLSAYEKCDKAIKNLK